MVGDRKMKANYISMVLLLAMICVSFANAKDVETHKAASQAVGFSGGWVTGSGVTYRHYFGDHFLQGTFFGVVSDNGNNTYVNTAFSAGTYLHKLKASGIIPPLGLKVMGGADVVLENRFEESVSVNGGSKTTRTIHENKSYFGGGVGLDIGNPGRAGLSLWIAANYVFAYDGITSPTFEWFGSRPAAGILYGW